MVLVADLIAALSVMPNAGSAASALQVGSAVTLAATAAKVGVEVKWSSPAARALAAQARRERARNLMIVSLKD
jgi:hypothetical protein